MDAHMSSPVKPLARPLDLGPEESEAKRQRIGQIRRPFGQPPMIAFGHLDHNSVAVTDRLPGLFDPFAGSQYLFLDGPDPGFDTEDYYDTVWQKVSTAVSRILANRPAGFLMQDLYEAVEATCQHGHGAKLYEGLAELCGSYVDGQKKLLAGRYPDFESGGSTGTSPTSVGLVSDVLAGWDEWVTQVKLVSSVVAFLDQSYSTPERLAAFKDVAISAFRNRLFLDPTVQKTMLATLADGADQLRDGKPGPGIDLGRISRMCRHLSVYSSVLEPSFLAATQTYLRAWRARMTDPFDLAEYCGAVLRLAEAETVRCGVLDLAESTRWEIVGLVDRLLISAETDRLIAAEPIFRLLDENRQTDLAGLFRLLGRVNLTDRLGPVLAEWVDLVGGPIVAEGEKSDVVAGLVGLKIRLDTTFDKSFGRHGELIRHIDGAFGRLINYRARSKTNRLLASRLPSQLSKFIDSVLRLGPTGIPAKISRPEAGGVGNPTEWTTGKDVDDSRDVLIRHAFDLFRFLEGKGAVERDYRADLARRLLLNRPADPAAERRVIDRFRAECGDSFVEAMTKMVDDVAQPRIGRTSVVAGVPDLSVLVLEAATWPSYPAIEVRLPPAIQKAHDRFEAEYRAKQDRRSLGWKHGLAHCVVTARFPLGTKELVLTGFQGVVIVQFADVADDGHLTYDDLQARTGLCDSDLKRTLQSLASAKIRPLIKHPRGREVDRSDRFTINPAFTHDRFRVKISQVQARDPTDPTSGPGGDDNDDSDEEPVDRTLELQSAVMKVIKAGKKMSKASIVAGVIEVTRIRGEPEPDQVVEALDKLFERDLLGKDVDDGEYTWQIDN